MSWGPWVSADEPVIHSHAMQKAKKWLRVFETAFYVFCVPIAGLAIYMRYTWLGKALGLNLGLCVILFKVCLAILLDADVKAEKMRKQMMGL